jgi:amino acid adenylation domain-containing protein
MEDLPLSFAQQRLWFLDQLEPGTPAYVITGRRRFLGPLDPNALGNAFTELVRRHESLRATFIKKHGVPVQQITAPMSITPQLVDLEALPALDRDAAARQIILERAQEGFDLEHGPLLRAVLIRFGPEDHELLVSVHHIVADGWSMGILGRELDTLYTAFVAGRPSPLPEELPIKYSDFVFWQRQWFTDQNVEAHKRYWLEHLRAPIVPLVLPADHPRTQRTSAVSANHLFELPQPLADCLSQLSHREHASPFMTLLAGFKVLLARYTGQTDIVVGTAVANRNYLELEPLIGCFVNSLVLRTDLAGDPTFLEVLARVRETCLDAYAHADMPFEKLVEELQPSRVLGQNPLFQVSFVMLDGATSTDFLPVASASPFDLTIFIHHSGGGTLSVTIQYKRDLFEPDAIARLAGHYRTLLESVVASPNCHISALPLLTEVEAHRLLVACNATTMPYPSEQTVHRLFEAQVDATPNAIALVSDGTTLTYAELERRANRLAHNLRTHGVGPEESIGVYLERSPDLLVALLGIVKAGCAYVGLDLLAPRSRLEFILHDAKVGLVLTQMSLSAQIPAHRVRSICLDDADGGVWARPETRLGDSISADRLAYVVYTSGSKGEPKGVAVTHRSVVRLVKGTDYAQFGSDEIFLQLAPLSFDASTFEIWGALLNGARLVIAPPGIMSADELGAVLLRHGVTTLWLTAGLFHQVVEHRIGILGGLRQLLTGGDVLSPPHVHRARMALPSCRLVNAYGPTEATTFTCCHAITNAAADAVSVPIGRPIANTRVYVLDQHQRPVPIGVPGELWIAGDGLARGYVNRPELTAERFVVKQISATLTERLYRSGDLVRWRRDDTLEFLGRLDDQVKTRGYRVELGEIEAALARHPGVREAVVTAPRMSDGERRLIGYVVVDGIVSAGDLRQFLAAMLPAYMIPVAIVTLDHFPLTANGKVDRQALPEPKPSNEMTDSAALPRDGLEQQLLAIWQNVLARRSIGIHDNFFDLGGHSLLAVRLFALLTEQLQVTLPLAVLFQAPTIAGQADLIRRGSEPAWRRSLVPIQPAGKRSPVFALPGVGGNVLGYNVLAQLLGPEQPFYGLQSRGLDGAEEPLARIEDIAAECLRDVRAVQPKGPYYLVGACMGGVVAYEMAQQLRTAGEDIALLALIETWPPMPTTVLSLQPSPRGRASAKIRFILERLQLYRTTLTQLHGRQRLRYLADRFKLCMEIVARRDLFRGSRSEFYLSLVRETNLRAFQLYKPCAYSGPVVLFCAEGREVDPESDYRLAWRQFIAALEVRSTPGADSGLILTEPYVQVLADQLKTCLDRARAVASPAGRST